MTRLELGPLLMFVWQDKHGSYAVWRWGPVCLGMVRGEPC